jgi:hypothetical protein
MTGSRHCFLANVVATILVSTTLLACSSTPTAVTKAPEVPPERVYYKSDSDANTAAKVVFVKDEGVWASIGYHQLFVDGKLAASIKTGERLQFQLSPGDYVFGILPTFLTTTKDEFIGGFSVTSLDQVLQPGKTYYYRILVDAENVSRIQRYVPSN